MAATQQKYYRKHYLADDLIERANKPKNATEKTSVISRTTQPVVAIATQKLSNSRTEWFMNDNYLSKITKCKERQNRDIIGQIRGSKFDIKRDRKRKGWVFKLLGEKIAEQQEIAESNTTEPLEEKGLEAAFIENNSSKRTRSRAGFSKYSNQFKEEKDISQCMEEITQEQLLEACRMSGKPFLPHAAKEIMAYLGRVRKCFFASIRQFMSYIAKCLNNELRNPMRCNLLNFKILKGRSKEEQQEQLTLNECEKYLKKTEDAGIFTRCDETQYKARIAGGAIPKFLAYNILTNTKMIKKVGDTLEICLAKAVEIPENHLRNMLDLAKGIGGYMGVERIYLTQ